METILADYTEMLHAAKKRLQGLDNLKDQVEYERTKQKISSYRGYIDELKGKIKEASLAALKDAHLKDIKEMSSRIEDPKISEGERISLRIKVNCFECLS
jgi:hypothetical protein